MLGEIETYRLTDPLTSLAPLVWRMIPNIARDACRWTPALQQLFESDTIQARRLVTCCGCGTQVEHQHSWSTIPYGRNGIKLPLPSYLFCVVCKNATDATVAWRKAYRSVKHG